MNKIHHSVRNGSDNCDRCKRPRMMHWRDKEERNGSGETFRPCGDFREVCEECYMELSGGKPPLGLHDLQAIRERGITREQYYKEHGY